MIESGESFLVALARRVPEDEHEDASVGMKLASSRSLGRGERIDWHNMITLDDKSGFRKRSIHILAFAVDYWSILCVKPLLR
jgi:hypothetical protein